VQIKVAVLDMAGTTVADEVRGGPFILAAYGRAFREAGIALGAEALNDLRGLDKRQVIRSVLAERGSRGGGALEAETDRLLGVFRSCCLDLIREVRSMEGAAEACRWLKERGAFVALASGLPQEIAEAMAREVGLLAPGLADYVTSGERAGGGRPGPEMINDVLIRCGMLGPQTDRHRPAPGFDYAQVLKLGDTPADVQEGRGVGAFTLAVASGTHSAERLRAEGPREVLSTIAELPALLERSM